MSVITNLIETYHFVYQVEKEYPLETIITTDLYGERLKLANSPCDQAIVKAPKQELDDKRQLLVLPDDQDPHYYLLLHENLFNDRQEYAQALAYSYTKLIDCDAYQQKYGVSNLRAAQLPDSTCLMFLFELRANYRSFSLYYNLTSPENKAVLFSYLCGLVPDYEQLLTARLTTQMPALAKFYGQALAIGAYVNFDVSLPDYLTRHHVHDLLKALHDHIDKASIFDTYEAVHAAYEDFVDHKSKIPEPHVQGHTCNHIHHDH